MPRGTRRLPEVCVSRLATADLILHGGDLVALRVLRELESLGSVITVHGNVDDAEVRTALPGVRELEAGERGSDWSVTAARRAAGWRV